MQHAAIAVGTSLALLALAGCASTHGSGPGADPRGRAQFETMKQLVGDWVTRSEGDHGGESVRYHLTAAGTVLVEELFRGSPHEMITMYHVDGDDLVLTHYCAAGNQPFMRAAPTQPDGTIVFTCVGGTNKAESDGHMHIGRMQVQSRSKATAHWTFYDSGKPTEEVTLQLARVSG